MAVASSQAYNWDIIAQLALVCHSDVVLRDTQTVLAHIGDMLQRSLQSPIGVLTTTRFAIVQAEVTWGLQLHHHTLDDVCATAIPLAEYQHLTTKQQYHTPVRVSLSVGNNDVGSLIVSHEQSTPIPDMCFYEVLAAQLGMILTVHYQTQQPHMPAPETTPETTPCFPGVERIIERQQEEIFVLHHVAAQAAKTQKPERIYHIVVDAIQHTLQAYQVRLMVYNRKEGSAFITAETVPSPLSSLSSPSSSSPSSNKHVVISLHQNAVATWLDEHKRPYIVHETAHHPLDANTQPEHSAPTPCGTMVFLPLMLNDIVLGYIEIVFATIRYDVTEDSLQMCRTISYHATRVIENTELFTQAQTNANALESKVGELSTLLEAARILGSLLKPDEVLNSLMDLVSRQLGVSTVALWTVGQDNCLTPAAIDGIPSTMATQMRVPIGQGLTGKVAATGLPLIVSDVEHQDDIHSLYPDFNRENRLVSFMGVPIFYHERIIGVLSVMTSEHHEFTNDEMMLLIGLAGQAAVALENARLFQERERRIHELSTINDISSTINSMLELDDLLNTLHTKLSELLDTSYSFIAVYDKSTTGQSPILRKRVGRHGNTIQRYDEAISLDGKGCVDYVVLNGKPLLLSTPDDITTFLRNTGKQYEIPIASWLGAPIMLGDDILGIIAMRSTTSYTYSTDDMRFLSTVASQAAIAIANARLFSERERRLREITVLKDISSAISSTLDLQGVIERLYYEMSQVIDMNTSLIGIYDEPHNMLSYPMCFDRGHRIYLDPASIREDSTEWVIRNRQPLLLHTTEQAQQMGLHEFGFSAFDMRSPQSSIRCLDSKIVQSCLAIPIISGDVVLGVINIKSYVSYAFDENDLRFMTTVASQVAVTLSNVQMFSERERRIYELNTFNEIGQALSSTVSIDELPRLIYGQTSRLIDTTNFYMALIDDMGEIEFPLFIEKGVAIEVESTWKSDKLATDAHDISLDFYNFLLYLIRRVIHRREKLLLKGSDLNLVDLNSLDELRDEVGAILPHNEQRPQAWLGVPMIAADKVIGVIAVQHYDNKSAYTSYDEHLLSTIASWAAIALENARLFEEISNLAASLERHVTDRTLELREANVQLLQEKEYLETVHAITMELTATLDLDTIINRALDVASINLGVSRGSIMLRELQSGALVCRAVLQDKGQVERADVPIAFAKGEGLAGWVMQHQEAVSIPDVHNDPRWVRETGRADNVRSVAAVPLMTGDTTLGVIILSSVYTNYFTESQLRLLATIANEVAIAINNAQLYSYINEMATRLADLLEQQKEENTRSHAILQSLTEGVIVLDEDEHIQLVNRAAEQMLDIPASDILFHPFHMLADYGTTTVQQRAKLLYTSLSTGLEKATESHQIYSMTIEFEQPKQTLAMNIAGVRTMDERNYGNVAVLRDITREIESDRTKREFISKVSHELRTPLTSIKGYVDVLLMQSMGTLNENQVHFLHVVKTNSKRLMELINDILDISRIDSGKIKLKLTLVDMKAIIYDVAESLRLEAEAKNLQVTLHIADDLPRFVADERRLTQIIFNLFSNAVKYTFEHGSIIARVFLNPSNFVQFEIEDTGVGMTPEQREKLFLPFYRADNPLREIAGGTGLGLSITKSLVEQHGGELWVTSEQGKGSTFCLILPLSPPIDNEQSDDEDQL